MDGCNKCVIGVVEEWMEIARRSLLLLLMMAKVVRVGFESVNKMAISPPCWKWPE